jgi:hypothetical protein
MGNGVAKMTRRFLRAVGRALIGVVLFAQLSVSAYACPGVSAAGTLATTLPSAMDCEDMTGAMDASSPNLCAEHCKYGQQSDHAPTLNAPAAVLTALYAMPVVPETAPPARPAAATLSALVAASPPHAILHCVHRI